MLRLRPLASPLVLSAAALAAGTALAVAAHGCSTSDSTTSGTPGADAGQDAGPRDEIDGIAIKEQLKLTGLAAPVRVVRDKRGMLHIYARSLRDAAMAQGYMTARDRAPQMELIRRTAEGRIAEWAGGLKPELASQDIFFRALGLRRAAQKYYDTLKAGSDTRESIEGYAAGVTAYFKTIRDGSAKIPSSWLGLPRARYLDWDAVASLTIGKLQTYALSYDAGEEIALTALYGAIKRTFRADSDDPALRARKGFPFDMTRFEPPAKVAVVPMPPGGPPMGARLRGGAAPFPGPAEISPAMLEEVDPMLRAGRAAIAFIASRDRGSFGSNNWVISPARSATGQTLVASDPHLDLSSPAIFHMVALHVPAGGQEPGLDVAGMAFAGIPGVVLGFNKHIAWGATVTNYDVTDVYKDTIRDGKVTMRTPTGPKQIAVEKIEEPFDYGDGRPEKITIEVIPGHGFVMPKVVKNRFAPREASEVLSIRWTGLEVTGELEALAGVNRAKNVDEARAAYATFQAGSQNWVIGDDQGNILYTTQSHVPVRPKAALAWDAKKFEGQLPCMVMPGDAGMEWSGRVPDALLPQAKNPPTGFIATANSDQYGVTFDNDPSNHPVYLGCFFDPGFRKARIDERINAKPKLALDDLASIQADVKSALGARITKHLVAAITRAEAARAGNKPAPDLARVLADKRYVPARVQLARDLLAKWQGTDFDTPAAVEVTGEAVPGATDIEASQATLVFNATLVRIFVNAFEDEWKAMAASPTDKPPPWGEDFQVAGLLRILDKPEPLATADDSGESVLWDDLRTKDFVESKDDRLLTSLLDGLEYLDKALGPDPSKWRWGLLHTIRHDSLLPGTEGVLSIPAPGDARFPAGGFPRHGDVHSVDASSFRLALPTATPSFSYFHGPVQRFNASLDPKGPVVRNVLAGGNVWIQSSSHFDDEAQMWRQNKNRPVSFSPGEVVVDAEERVDLSP